MNAAFATPGEILAFWFEELQPLQWWAKSPQVDRQISDRFAALHAAATRCELYAWRTHGDGRLAEIIVLDQFSRNIHRGRAAAFAADGMALALAQEAVSLGVDDSLPIERRAFLYLPYMHSESAAIHAIAVRLFSAPGLADHLAFELRHQTIIERFGRYPHRNATLGRPSTPEEMAFLQMPGSSF
ncbi:MAG: DUF924 family protein [Accumulibacter sp.]|uniref:DUF924 family protein n=1 Tax=Accumulibacter sp. TaxID=2053492 RepID=UPI002FC29BAF